MYEELKTMIHDKIKLSDAYPPTSVNNFNYVADCHQLLSQYNIDKITSSDITYRPIKYRADIKQIKKLHQEWFPIIYSDEYYEQIFKNSTCTLVAEVKLTFPSGRKENTIIGSMFYQVKLIKPSLMQYSFLNDWKEMVCGFFNLSSKYGVYITTLGVVNELRGKGIALKMLRILQDTIKDKMEAKYIYLDMVTYNNAAAHFYERNDFIQLKTKKQHYDIEGVKYDAYVYVWYKDESKRKLMQQQCMHHKQSLFRKVKYQLPSQILKSPLQGLYFLKYRVQRWWLRNHIQPNQ